jgi:hypothetical protein
MNRVLLLTVLIVAIAAILVMVGVAGRSSGPPEQVSAAADSYAKVLTAQMDQYVTVRTIVHAADPAALRSEMSKLTYSDGLIFRVSYSLTDQHQVGGRGIPYPPQDAWCAGFAAGDQTELNIVVIARHMDLYNSEWIVHTLADPAATTAAIGCRLNK